MKRLYILLPILFAGFLLLAACATALDETLTQRGEEGAATLPSDTPDSPQETQTGESAHPAGEPTPGAIPTPTEDELDDDEYRIVTLLTKDAIPSIDDPQFLTVEEANLEYDPDEEVLGVVFDGDARAYSVPLLSRHEIVNDTVGGRAIAVTW